MGWTGLKLKQTKMKKYKFFALAFAAMTLAACSSDDVVDNGAKPGAVAPGEQGYVSLNLNLPTQPSTRAANDDFAEGTADEYAVKDGVLLLFKGSTEADATCQSAYNLDVAAAGFAVDGSEQIDSKGTIVQKITVPQTGNDDKIYVLAVLNTNGLITVDGSNIAKIGQTSLSNKKLSDITSEIVSADGAKLTSNGILMSNAPLYKGTAATETTAPSGEVKTLAEVDQANICATQSEASSKPAADIYVERAVAKVTVKSTATAPTGGNKITALVVQGWTLDVTNNKTYLVRNVNATTSWWGYASTTTTVNKDGGQFRFVGTSPVKTGYYRTYWGIDPNYSSTTTTDFTNKQGQELATTALTAVGSSLYCAENTFDLNNMNENATTAVVVKAKLTVDGAETSGSFYTINGNNSVIYQKAGIENYVKNIVQQWIETNKSTYIKNGTISPTDLTVALSNTGTGDKGGYITATSVTYTGNGVTEWADKQSKETLNAAIAAELETLMGNTQIAYYKNGETYYTIRIKHFGDDLTPWVKPTGNSSAYGSNEQDYLGRWGVLRNNWYEVNVKSITNIGYPSVPPVTNTSDDPTASYISATINVLSWSKRAQDVNL